MLYLNNQIPNILQNFSGLSAHGIIPAFTEQSLTEPDSGMYNDIAQGYYLRSGFAGYDYAGDGYSEDLFGTTL